MNVRNLSTAFSIFVGVGILATWSILLATGNVPELQTSPFEQGFLLLAEFTTAALMLAAAYGLLRRRRWGTAVELIALGLLLYCAIFSIGFFGQQENIPAAIFFGIIALVDAAISTRLVTQYGKGISLT